MGAVELCLALQTKAVEENGFSMRAILLLNSLSEGGGGGERSLCLGVWVAELCWGKGELVSGSRS